MCRPGTSLDAIYSAMALLLNHELYTNKIVKEKTSDDRMFEVSISVLFYRKYIRFICTFCFFVEKRGYRMNQAIRVCVTAQHRAPVFGFCKPYRLVHHNEWTAWPQS